MKTRTVVLNNDNGSVESFRYPGGEWQVRIKDATMCEADSINVISHIRSSDDVMKTILLGSALDDINISAERTLILPYLPYSRADRRFTEGDCFGLEVFANMIDQYYFQVATLDAHSSVAEEQFENLLNVPAEGVIKRACLKFARALTTDQITVLFPDQGARNRYDLPSYVGNNTGVVTLHKAHCTKHRDPVTGKLTGFEVPESEHPAIIVDDICDGGGTFLGIAAAFKRPPRLGLYVTHGIFSKGIGELKVKFANIYTTDTIYDERFGKYVTVLDGVTEITTAISVIQRSRRSVTA